MSQSPSCTRKVVSRFCDRLNSKNHSNFRRTSVFQVLPIVFLARRAVETSTRCDQDNYIAIERLEETDVLEKPRTHQIPRLEYLLDANVFFTFHLCSDRQTQSHLNARNLNT